MSEENKIEEDFKIEDPDFVSKFDRSVGQPTLDAAPRTASEVEDQEAYDAYFAKGGKVTVYDGNDRTENLVINPWQRGKGRPKATPEAKSSKDKK
jgi:hypothetical protein|tara:strand:- start:619 stop:903 length:285 start_codon:yes stop_codon:yes gene_type:complete